MHRNVHGGIRLTVAQAIAEFLREKKVTTAFGIIGAGNIALFDAIARKKATEIVCCHHEQAAVMAANAWARVRGDGAVGVAIVTTGAGSANAITGALAALMDRAPVLIISGNEPSRYLYADCRVAGVQGFKTGEAVEPFVKLARTLGGIDMPMECMHEAWETALSGRRGPVWLDCPRDTFNATV